MAEKTLIAWTDHTFNIAWGCWKLSPGCANCYADVFDHRIGGDHWGKGKSRRTFGPKHWDQPRLWNAIAEREGRRHKVFCSSMTDVFLDDPTIEAELRKLWPLIRETPWLDWQLLTKRPERIAASLPAGWGDGWPNVWLGTSVEDQERAGLRLPVLLEVPAVVHFASCEPLLEPLDLRPWLGRRFECPECGFDEKEARSGLPDGKKYCGICAEDCGRDVRLDVGGRMLDWVIVGGESKGDGKFRPMDHQWARDLRGQCRGRAAFFFKQSAARYTERGIELDGEVVREFPEVGLPVPA